MNTDSVCLVCFDKNAISFSCNQCQYSVCGSCVSPRPLKSCELCNDLLCSQCVSVGVCAGCDTRLCETCAASTCNACSNPICNDCFDRFPARCKHCAKTLCESCSFKTYENMIVPCSDCKEIMCMPFCKDKESDPMISCMKCHKLKCFECAMKDMFNESSGFRYCKGEAWGDDNLCSQSFCEDCAKTELRNDAENGLDFDMCAKCYDENHNLPQCKKCNTYIVCPGLAGGFDTCDFCDGVECHEDMYNGCHNEEKTLRLEGKRYYSGKQQCEECQLQELKAMNQSKTRLHPQILQVIKEFSFCAKVLA